MRVLLLGHGRMGQLVESLAPSYGAEIAGVIKLAKLCQGGSDFKRFQGLEFSTRN